MEKTINQKHKDRLFCRLFGSEEYKENTLSLYNALNHTSYENADELSFTTLEDAVYIHMKNDVSFIIADNMNLYEHQSTFNPNMPLRGLMYFSSLYGKYIDTHKRNIFSRTLIPIPTPNYMVFYNGTEPRNAIEHLHLSDAFINKSHSGEFEWTATMLNLNHPNNADFLRQCRPLSDYTIFISKIQLYSQTMAMEEAIDCAVDECISKGILDYFLSKHKAEVKSMVIYEFNEETYKEEVRRETEARMSALIQKLFETNRSEELLRASTDKDYLNKLYAEFQL